MADEQNSIAPRDPLPPGALEAFNRMLEQQRAETELELQKHHDNTELEKLRIQKLSEESERNYTLASKSLDLQAEDLRDSRKTDKSKIKMSLILLISLAILFTVVIVAALFTNNTQVIIEASKLIVYGGAGGGITYGVTKHKQSKADNSNSEIGAGSE